jgi:hypothetical protein
MELYISIENNNLYLLKGLVLIYSSSNVFDNHNVGLNVLCVLNMNVQFCVNFNP